MTMSMMRVRYYCDGCGRLVEGNSDLKFPDGWLATPRDWDAHLPRAPFSLAIVACSADCVSAAKAARVEAARAAVEKFAERVRDVWLCRTDEPPNQEIADVEAFIEDIHVQVARRAMEIIDQALKSAKVPYSDKGVEMLLQMYDEGNK